MSFAQTLGVNPDEYRKFVSRVLRVWSGYSLAIDLNSGGPETTEKHEWFTSVLAEHILLTRGLDAADLEEWMNNIFYSDFDLILEDDSCYPTAFLLLEALGYMKNGNQERLAQLVAGLPSEEQVKAAKKASVREGNDDDEEMDGDSASDDDDECDAEEREVKEKKERQPRTVTDDDGWTTIVSHK